MDRLRVASGVSELDRLLGGIYIGDNVVWHDDAGSLASVFCLNFIQASQAHNRPVIYISFDRSPRNLLEKLGALAENQSMTILDCFTHGKGAGSDVFMMFYNEEKAERPCRIILVEEPRQIDKVADAFYGIHETMEGDVRFVFESLTGMQELWGGEEQLLNFYSHSCPRLYELNTIVYWIMEKRAHSPRFKAMINQIAQVAIELSVKRGKTSLNILKAEKRDIDTLNKPLSYWTEGLKVTFESEAQATGKIELGKRLKKLRGKRGLSQTELAKQVGVTPSTISQIESDLIYPSLLALIKIAEVLSVGVSSFFQDSSPITKRVIFSAAEATQIKFNDLPSGSINAKALTSLDLRSKAEPYLVEIPPNKSLPSHFFIHKGEEVGYLLAGKLLFELDKVFHTIRAGDVIYLTSEIPSMWKNPGPGIARLLWLKIW